MRQQVAHPDLLRHVVVVQPEIWEVVDDTIVPGQPAGIDLLGEGGRRECFRVRRDGVERVLIDRLGGLHVADAMPALQNDSAVLHDGYGNARYGPFRLRPGEVRIQCLNIDPLRREGGREKGRKD